MRYVYCPLCGQRLSARVLGDEGSVPWCDGCNRPWFDGFSTCVIAAVVNEEGEIALLREARRPDREVLVAGYIKPGEDAETTVRREITEELGLRPEAVRLLWTVWHAKADQLMIAFLVRVAKAPLKLSRETRSAAWAPLAEAVRRVPAGSTALRVTQAALAAWEADEWPR